MVLEKVIDIIAEELSVDPSEITWLRIWTQIPLLLLILSCPSKMLST